MTTYSNQLENLFTLSKKVAVYVPSTMYNVPMTNEEHAQAVTVAVDDLTSILGGTTSYKAKGSYKADNGEIIKEDVTVVQANCTEDDFNLAVTTVIALANHLKTEYKQEAVSIEVDGQLYFV